MIHQDGRTDIGACWWRMARWPLAFALLFAVIISVTDVDIAVARWLFFDASAARWRGAESWVANELIHSGGGWLVRGAAMVLMGLWVATFGCDRLRPWRRPVGYFLLSTLTTVGVVGILKHVTNMDCPWDLVPFGGRFPYVHLFADRPDALRSAHCFPAAHASSGYALMALYFVGLERGRRQAWAGLLTGLAFGLAFGIAQQSRGAHFVSHDLGSAMIAWIVSLTFYCAAFRCRLWSSAAVTDRQHGRPIPSGARHKHGNLPTAAPSRDAQLIRS